MTGQVCVRYRAGDRPRIRDAIRSLWRHRVLFLEFTRRNLLAATRGSVLGLGWIVFMPIVMMALYTFVFGVVFGGRYGVLPDESGPEYALGIFLSLSVFQVLADPMGEAPRHIASTPSLVKKVVFPLEVMPVSLVAAQLVRFLVSLSLVVLGAFLLGRGALATWVWLPVLMVPLVLLSTGVALMFSAIGVFVRDLSEIARVLSMVLLFGSGVFFSVEHLPEIARHLLGINPLLHLLEGFRGAMLWGRSPDSVSLAYASASALAVFLAGLACFQRLRGDFADVI